MEVTMPDLKQAEQNIIHLLQENNIRSSYNNAYRYRHPHEFSIGQGWYPLMYDLLQALVDLGWSGTITQVKEKFGSLRFYATRLTETMDAVVNRTENQSSTTCELCGVAGSIHVIRGWLITLCPACARNKELDN
jgi:hypothetical protein